MASFDFASLALRYACPEPFDKAQDRRSETKSRDAISRRPGCES